MLTYGHLYGALVLDFQPQTDHYLGIGPRSNGSVGSRKAPIGPDCWEPDPGAANILLLFEIASGKTLAPVVGD